MNARSFRGGLTHADKNSASEAVRHKLQIPAVTRPQMTDVDPPLGRASDKRAQRAVYELRTAITSPSIESIEKLY